MRKQILTTAAFVLAGTAFACAQDEQFYVTAEGFASFASKSTTDLGRLDIAGLWGTFGTSVETDSDFLSLDFGSILAIGGGSVEEKFYAGTYRQKERLDQSDLFIGPQVGLTLNFSDTFSLTAGVMAGVDIRAIDWEYRYHDYGSYVRCDRDDTAIGAFYGLYLRADTKIANRWSLTASLRAMGTSTENEWKTPDGGKYRTDKTGYTTLTVGAKFSF